MSLTKTAAPTTGPSSTGTGRAPCGCQEQTPPQPCCCNLVCFDRPNYFCGHLLTDADLTLQQKYVVEKNKLYHRTMDGHGVVCGLKLTCDCDCKGHILVHDGFGIDDCGNDLIVCETKRFDVISALKHKGLLVLDLPEDDCEPRRHRSRCEIKQCFYVTICYQETESEYETPFQSSCTSGPKQCLPTRTHEGVRFDVTDKLPPRYSYLDELAGRIEDCFRLNGESPLGSLVSQHAEALQSVFNDPDPQRDYCELFCLLRAYFLNYLKTHPDQFNCNLSDEVSCLSCPQRDHRRSRRQDAREDEVEREFSYHEEMQGAFRKLLYFMQRYQYDCVFGDLIFSCSQPCEAHCVVLGTVEIVDGKLVRVCNTPRTYLWNPANLMQVLIFEILSGRSAFGREGDDKRIPCCPDYEKFDPTYFLAEFRVSQHARMHAATAAVRAVREVSHSLNQSFDFTDSMAISPEVFAAMRSGEKREEVDQLKAVFGIHASEEQLDTGKLSAFTPSQALQAHALLRRDDAVVAYESQQETKRVITDFVAAVAPNRAVGKAIETLLTNSTKNAQELTDLRSEIDSLKAQMGVDDTKRQQKKGSSKHSDE